MNAKITNGQLLQVALDHVLKVGKIMRLQIETNQQIQFQTQQTMVLYISLTQIKTHLRTLSANILKLNAIKILQSAQKEVIIP